MNKSINLEQDSDDGRGFDIDSNDQSNIVDGAPISLSPSSDGTAAGGRTIEENKNQIPSSADNESYNDYADAKESDVPNLVPPTHRNVYETFYGDMDNTTATSIISSDSNDSSQTSFGATITSSTGQDSKKSRPGGSLETFPMKMYRMLSVIEDLGYSSIISWKPHGRAFQVNDVNQFVKLVLPKFFRQSKITSFQRQLNLYGFKRFLNGPDNGAYYHELFLRDKTFLCKAIFRTKVKGKTNKRRKAAELLGSEPDFYQMKTLPTLNPEDRKLRLQSFFDTEEDLGHFTTFLSSTVVVQNKNEPKKKRSIKTASTGKRKRKDSHNNGLEGTDYNLLEDRQSSPNDDADDEKEEISGTPFSSRQKAASKKRDLPFNSIEFGFLQDSIASAPDQQLLQETTSEQHSLKPHRVDRSRESSADASLLRRWSSLSSSQSSSHEIAHPCSAQNNNVQTQVNQPRRSSILIDLVPTPIPIIQQNEHAYFRMMLIDDDFKNLFHNLLKN
mmetsp:Transcript_15413/g.23042  ORF Transcript_15413/g.23042 Transcript_15413/m.23042 type:complete len:501 (-) Transcript_15413:1764-3266(-)